MICKHDELIMKLAMSFFKSRIDICQDVMQETYLDLYSIFGSSFDLSFLAEETVIKCTIEKCKLLSKNEIRNNPAKPFGAIKYDLSTEEYFDILLSHSDKNETIKESDLRYKSNTIKLSEQNIPPIDFVRFSNQQLFGKGIAYHEKLRKIISIKENEVRGLSENGIGKRQLVNLRWGNQVRCPECGSIKVYHTNRGYTCGKRGCSKKFSVLVGTLFENAKIPLHLYFAIIFSYVRNRCKANSYLLARVLEITQGSSWKIIQKLPNEIEVIDQDNFRLNNFDNIISISNSLKYNYTQNIG